MNNPVKIEYPRYSSNLSSGLNQSIKETIRDMNIDYLIFFVLFSLVSYYLKIYVLGFSPSYILFSFILLIMFLVIGGIEKSHFAIATTIFVLDAMLPFMIPNMASYNISLAVVDKMMFIQFVPFWLIISLYYYLSRISKGSYKDSWLGGWEVFALNLTLLIIFLFATYPMVQDLQLKYGAQINAYKAIQAKQLERADELKDIVSQQYNLTSTSWKAIYYCTFNEPLNYDECYRKLTTPPKTEKEIAADISQVKKSPISIEFIQGARSVILPGERLLISSNFQGYTREKDLEVIFSCSIGKTQGIASPAKYTFKQSLNTFSIPITCIPRNGTKIDKGLNPINFTATIKGIEGRGSLYNFLISKKYLNEKVNALLNPNTGDLDTIYNLELITGIEESNKFLYQKLFPEQFGDAYSANELRSEYTSGFVKIGIETFIPPVIPLEKGQSYPLRIDIKNLLSDGRIVKLNSLKVYLPAHSITNKENCPDLIKSESEQTYFYILNSAISFDPRSLKNTESKTILKNCNVNYDDDLLNTLDNPEKLNPKYIEAELNYDYEYMKQFYFNVEDPTLVVGYNTSANVSSSNTSTQNIGKVV